MTTKNRLGQPYLRKPAHDVASASVGTTQGNITLASVPDLISVEALGRCVATSATAGNDVLIFTPPILPTLPGSFTSPPGYTFVTTSTGSATATTAYPYDLYTNTSQQIAAQANGTSTLQCMTDGWVWHRGK